MHYEKFADGSVKCIEDEIPFELPAGWAWCRIFSITEDLPYGTARKSSSEGKIAVLRMGNIQAGEIDYTDLVYSSDDNDIQQYALQKNDLVFNRTHSAEWVGKTAIYRGNIPAIYAGYLIRVRPYIDAEYLNVVMNSGYAKRYCNSVKTDGVNQSNINAQKLGSFLIPIPPQAETIRISGKIASILPLIDLIEARKSDLFNIIDMAKSKILDLAIHGQLVPQDPDDEPASILLDRIRAEKEELIKQGKLKRDKKESVIFKGEDNSYYLRTGELEEPLDGWRFDDLPDSWGICCLGEVCDYGDCVNVDTADIADDSWILDLEDIEKDTGKILKKVTKAQRNSVSTKHQFHSGQVLYSKLRPYLNKVVLTNDSGYCTSEILPLEFNACVLPAYARYYLMSGTFLAYADRCAYGVKMPRLGTTDGKKAIFSLPPLAEQKRIVEKIEAYFSELNKISEAII